jgi:hypothetical protein
MAFYSGSNAYSAQSMAQIPVPVPRSKIFCGFLTGALKGSPFNNMSQLDESVSGAMDGMDLFS